MREAIFVIDRFDTLGVGLKLRDSLRACSEGYPVTLGTKLHRERKPAVHCKVIERENIMASSDPSADLGSNLKSGKTDGANALSKGGIFNNNDIWSDE